MTVEQGTNLNSLIMREASAVYKRFRPMPWGALILGVCDDGMALVMDVKQGNRSWLVNRDMREVLGEVEYASVLLEGESLSEANPPLLIDRDQEGQFAQWAVAMALLENLDNPRFPRIKATVATKDIDKWSGLESREKGVLQYVDPSDLAREYSSGKLKEKIKPDLKIVVIDGFRDFAGSFPVGAVNDSVKGFLNLVRDNGRSVLINFEEEGDAQRFASAQGIKNPFIVKAVEGGKYGFVDGNGKEILLSLPSLS